MQQQFQEYSQPHHLCRLPWRQHLRLLQRQLLLSRQRPLPWRLLLLLPWHRHQCRRSHRLLLLLLLLPQLSLWHRLRRRRAPRELEHHPSNQRVSEDEAAPGVVYCPQCGHDQDTKLIVVELNESTISALACAVCDYVI